MKSTNKITPLLCIALLLVAGAPSQARADDYNSICGSANLAAANANPSMNENSGQISQYCADALAQSKTSSAEDTMWKIYAAVTVVCTAACFTTFVPAGAKVCMGSGLAAAATDALLTKNFMSAMTEAMTSASGMLFAQGAGAAATAGASQSTGMIKDKGSCVAAAGAAFATFQANQAATSAKSTEATDLANAKQLENATNSNSQQSMGQTLTSAATPGNTTPGNTGSSLNTTGTALQGTSMQAAASCDANSSSTVAGAVQCAATANPNLASLVGTPEFGSAFQAASGMPLGNFLSGAQKPSQAISQGLGGMVSPTGVGTLQSALAQLESTPLSDPSGSTYAGGSGSGGGAGKASGDDMSAMMNSLMSQFGPKKKGDTSPNGVSAAEFDAQRKLASITAEDRSVSIFARVALRYAVLSPSLVSPIVATSQLTRAPASNNPAQKTLKEW